jgi:hypothetical protein
MRQVLLVRWANPTPLQTVGAAHQRGEKYAIRPANYACFEQIQPKARKTAQEIAGIAGGRACSCGVRSPH